MLWGLDCCWYRLTAEAWPRWLMSRIWLARRGLLPWRLMAFLAAARDCGVLRQNGAVYQFRHIELQHRLAARHPAQSTAAPPRGRDWRTP